MNWVIMFSLKTVLNKGFLAVFLNNLIMKVKCSLS
jgi:hypothetical protein